MDLFPPSNKTKKSEKMNLFFKGSRNAHSKDYQEEHISSAYYGSTITGADANRPTADGKTGVYYADQPTVRDMTEDQSFSTEENSSLKQRGVGRAGKGTAFLSIIVAVGLVYSLQAGNTSSTLSRDTSINSSLGEGASIIRTRPYVASPKMMAAAPKAPTPMLFTAHINGINGNMRCTKDSDCGKSMWCLIHERINWPIRYHCYACLNTQDCPAGKSCMITADNAYCTSNDVDEPPSFYYIEKGYNIFKGDPMYMLGNDGSFGVSDPGHETESFYNHIWSSDSTYKINLEGNTYYQPVGFDIKGENIEQMIAATRSITNTKEYTESVGRSVSFGGDGTTPQGINLGGNVGVATYQETSELASQTTTLSSSEIYSSLYHFKMKKTNMKLSLTDRATETLNDLAPDSDDKWKTFYDNFGTHIITEGIFGAFTRATYSFTEAEREELTKIEKDFETTLNIGIPEILNFGGSTGSEESKEIGNRISEMNENVRATNMGDINDLTKSPGLIQRSLVPICDFIDYSVFTNINSDYCYKQMKNYCIDTLKESGLTNTEGNCAYPSFFECVVDRDCADSKTGSHCNGGRCTECRKDADCPGKYQGCNKAGKCYRLQAFKNADCGVQQQGYVTDCSYYPSCPHDYKTYDKGRDNCWAPRTRVVCRANNIYLAPPCKKLLEGTCGGGSRGNGCCMNTGHCSLWGWCSFGQAHADSVTFPSTLQCYEMMGYVL